MAKYVFIHSSEVERFEYPVDCPFKAQRATRTRQILSSMGLLESSDCEQRSPIPATREQLLTFHTPAYLEVLQKASAGVFDPVSLYMGLGAPDCPVFKDMFEFAALACGGTLLGSELIASGAARVVFNPSGGFHHADPAVAAGFCYLNDVALGCQQLAAAGKRVLFLDLDAHHGDGVQRAFYQRADVMTLSFHESGKTLYPGTGFEEEIGEGPGQGYSVNFPLPVGTYDDAYFRLFCEGAWPLIGAFRPDVIVLELGMDGLTGDPLVHLHLTNNVFADIIRKLKSLHLPLLVTGGGGYHPENTARGWALAWSVLTRAEPQEDLTMGLGGVLLQSAEWKGGLRDRVLISDGGHRQAVDEAIAITLENVKRLIFPLHGL